MLRSFNIAAICLLLITSFGLAACKTDDGFRSTYRTQSDVLPVDVKTATGIAEDVLEELELIEVKGSATAVDGRVTGKTSDGSDVVVNIERETDESSKVKVRIGQLGDPDLGVLILKKIEEAAAEEDE